MGRIKSKLRVDSRGRRRGDRFMTLYKNRKGYLMVHLAKDDGGKLLQVHRVVAFAFPEICGEWFDGAQVNHKNENKTDNRADNLEWCSSKYNNNYGHRTEKTSVKIKQIDLEGNIVAIYKSETDAAKKTNINRGNISSCCVGLRDTAGNYRWSYE